MCPVRLSAGLALLLLLAAAQSSPDPFGGIPNLDIGAYEVAGTSPAAIRKDMDAKRPADPNDGTPVDSVAHWNYRWRLQWRPDGGCAAEVTFSGTVRLPHLVDDPKRAGSVTARWNRYMAALRTHESGHVRFAWDQAGRLRATLEAGSCDVANAAGQRVLEDIRRHDVEYDRETGHGRKQGAVFP
ncbi:DUF922 domain-containing protein [Sphingomonas sp.]|uniref:DUF922 domain-containing protein n=1 Tax=Sphingomonas sp. TaxID=28214 RepID=UPI001AFE6E1C|nr:DUF922 domain-containing protein [Sphingomonas sp.]MBO9712877.1 DUF922 domain-containing protein [Sphingomonas sp.]